MHVKNTDGMCVMRFSVCSYVCVCVCVCVCMQLNTISDLLDSVAGRIPGSIDALKQIINTYNQKVKNVDASVKDLLAYMDKSQVVPVSDTRTHTHTHQRSMETHAMRQTHTGTLIRVHMHVNKVSRRQTRLSYAYIVLTYSGMCACVRAVLPCCEEQYLLYCSRPAQTSECHTHINTHINTHT